MTLYQFYYIVSVILYIYSEHVTGSEYYVSAPNEEPCSPTIDLPCHNLSFYSDDYFTDDTIFYFLEGTHTLQRTLEINDVSNLTLQGLGHIEQGFHETVMQSTSVIMCSNFIEGGIVFTDSKTVVVKALTIANCWFTYQITKYNSSNVTLCFLNVSAVTLEWISIQNGSGTGLLLQNAYNVSIADSSFAQNQLNTHLCPAGNAFLHYKDTDNPEKLYRVDIVRSNFSLGYCIKYCKHFVASGCGLSIKMENTKYKVDIYIDSAVFYGNTAYLGANFYFQVSIAAHCSLIMNNTVSSNGNALIPIAFTSYAGMYLYQEQDDTYYSSYYDSHNNEYVFEYYYEYYIYDYNVSYGEVEVIIENSNFSDNFAGYVGGVGVKWLSGGRIEFRNCIIYNNTGNGGAGLYVSVEQFYVYAKPPSFIFKNVLIHFNRVQIASSVYQAAVYLSNIHNIMFEQIMVVDHNTTGLLCFQAQLTFDKSNCFVNNRGIYGGGMALYGSSRLLIKEQMNTLFINNHANQSGGGIFVSQVVPANSPSRSCFFKFSYPSDATVYFVNNTAGISGDVLYGGNIEDCENIHDYFYYFPQRTSHSISSDPTQVCFCESEILDCSIKSTNKTAIPGIGINVSLAAVGSLNGLTIGKIRLMEYSTNINTIHEISAHCTNITYVASALMNTMQTQIYATLDLIINPILDSMAKIIKVTILSCPIGFLLVNNACVCRPELTEPPISCDINTQVITREGDLWIGYENKSNCVIVHQNCPFHYCKQSTIQFTISSPDPQCLLNRSGILCGQCAEGLSLMLGFNQCGKCTDDYLALIIPFALAGIVLVVFLIALNLTVSVGTINGLIFYANVVKLYAPVFFPNGPIPFLSQFISWINLDLGIETCFYNGMDSCSKTWLQFIFPFYVWFLLILIIIMARYSNKVVRLVGTHVIPVLATMILLSYTKLIRTVFQTLNYVNIKCTNEKNETLLNAMWYSDANVQYLGDCHLPLFLFSVAVLILLIVPYTCFLIAIPLFEGPLSKYMCYQKFLTYMKPFFDAYGGPYKDKCRFWTGFLLFIRIILALAGDFEEISIDVLLSCLVCIIFMYFLLRGIYRQFSLVLLEVSFILNLVVMSYVSVQAYQTSNEEKYFEVKVLNGILISSAFVVFCGIIGYHIKTRLQQLITNVKKIFKKGRGSSSSDDTEIPLAASSTSSIVTNTIVSVIRRRESMLGIEDDLPHEPSADYVPFL